MGDTARVGRAGLDALGCTVFGFLGRSCLVAWSMLNSGSSGLRG